MSPGQISEVLNVSVQWVSKWKGKYETAGATGLLVSYQGTVGYLVDFLQDTFFASAKFQWY